MRWPHLASKFRFRSKSIGARAVDRAIALFRRDATQGSLNSAGLCCLHFGYFRCAFTRRRETVPFSLSLSLSLSPSLCK